MQLPKEEKHNLKIKVDPDFEFKYNFENHEDKGTRLLVEAAQKKEADKGHQWNAQYKFPKTNELVKFSNYVYQSYAGKIDIKLDTHWKLLYRVRGQKVLFKSFKGFYGELYFNTKNYYLQLVIKGTTPSNMGDVWSDIENILRKKEGGILDSAFTFGETVRKLINNFTCKPMLLITGHSLGGFLAQLITYTITYCYVDIDGEVRSREEPTDDFGIYTIVFDSPAIYDHIRSIDARDPIKSERFILPIINFVADVNLINTNSWIGKHLGIVLVIKDFNCTGEASKRERAANLPLHLLKTFENIVLNECHKVENLPGRRTVKYKKKLHPILLLFDKRF